MTDSVSGCLKKLLSLRALTKLMRGNLLTTESGFNGFRQPEINPCHCEPCNARRGNLPTMASNTLNQEITTLRLTALLAMTGIFRQPEKLLSLRALTKLMRGNLLTTENRFNGFRQPEINPCHCEPCNARRGNLPTMDSNTLNQKIATVC